MKTDRQQLFESASIPKAYFTLTIPSVLGKVIILANALFGYYGVIAAQAVTDLISAGIAVFLVRKHIWKKWIYRKNCNVGKIKPGIGGMMLSSNSGLFILLEAKMKMGKQPLPHFVN